MDRATGPEPPGKRLYHEPFNPAVFPFKRMTALDAVAARRICWCWPSARPARTRLRVLGADKRQERSRRLLGIDRRSTSSPGAGCRCRRWRRTRTILAARVEPAVDVTFARDGADNQYVMSPAGGRHRLVWLTDAPQRYFAGEIAPGAAPRRRAARCRSRCRRRATARGDGASARLGLDARPTAPLGAAVDGLVAWFRAFEPGDPPRATDSTYEDLALAQKGSCRHRSYAFVITAMAMGIPARYVENELHVFVEVFVPRVGWRRINLGGALARRGGLGADGKVPYRPKGGDPFPQPTEFANEARAAPAEGAQGRRGGRTRRRRSVVARRRAAAVAAAAAAAAAAVAAAARRASTSTSSTPRSRPARPARASRRRACRRPSP